MQFAVTKETYIGRITDADNSVELCNTYIAQLKEDKNNRETYGDLEAEIHNLNDVVCDLFLYYLEEKRKVSFEKTKFADAERDNHKSVASLEKATEAKFATDDDRIEGMKNVLNCYKGKKEGIDRFAGYMKDYFFYDQQGSTRTT